MNDLKRMESNTDVSNIIDGAKGTNAIQKELNALNGTNVRPVPVPQMTSLELEDLATRH